MKQLEKILVPLDFGKASEEALRMAMHLANPFDSEILLLHVIPEIKHFSAVRGQIRNQVIKKMKEVEKDLHQKGLSSVSAIVRFGTPFERIIEYSEELNVNLITMGSGGVKTNGPLGSVAEKVTTYASAPVLIVKRSSSPRVRNILCPVDFSEPSRRALKNAIFLSNAFQAHLTVLTVFEPLLSHYFGIHLTPGASKEKIIVRRQQQSLERFLRGFQFENISWNKLLRRGKPDEEILQTAKETRSDLLIMGSSGKTGFTRMVLGSITEKVLRALPCSALILKEEHIFRSPLVREVTYLENHFRRGKELLRGERVEGAIAQFEHCLRKDPFFIPAWEALAVAFRHLGQEKEARRCEEMSAYIRRHLWQHEKKEIG